MSDREVLVGGADNAKPSEATPDARRQRDRDDLVGLQLNMLQKIDFRQIGILWLMFIFLHTEMFAEIALKPISGATNSDGSMSEKGTLWASVYMIMTVILSVLIF